MYCEVCGEKTNKFITDDKYNERYLCKYCISRFELCECCNEFKLGEELSEDGICDECKK
ncbi:hypothetical protein [Clostridium perfringens]|uniref:Uncharacterized protein n=1 Tax=Clostridium perfringens TaxID=1502 RepID=A0A140GR78_CLOPF|nr:hypothetical protein [Clostridium perfringens]AMN31037.1 hypothetical protein JFP838_pA0121 [Clostridium perfringens]